MGIAAIKADIANIKTKRTALQSEAQKAKANADAATTEEEKNNHLKAHITAGAQEQDLSQKEEDQNKALTTLASLPKADPKADPNANGGQNQQLSALSTDGFDQQWEAMRGKLKGMLNSLHSHVDTIKGIAKKHFAVMQGHLK